MRRVLIVGYDDAELLDISCPSDVFDTANRLSAEPVYDVRLASLRGEPVRCSSGMALLPHERLEHARGPLDTLIMSGGLGHDRAAANPQLVARVRDLAAHSTRVASVCSGATILAAAGLLTGRRATTHWAIAADFARANPDVEVDPAPLFIRAGHVYTSAGVTSALDLALTFVEDDLGAPMARTVARWLVTYLHRPGNQAQVSMFLTTPPPDNDVVRSLCDHLTANLADDLSTPALAAKAGLSPRHLTRVFDTELNTTPARYVRTLRTEAAAHLLSSTDLPLRAVARRCGFRTTETLRQAFLHHFDTTPSAYRNAHQRKPA